MNKYSVTLKKKVLRNWKTVLFYFFLFFFLLNLSCEEYFQLCKMCWNLNKDLYCCFSQSEPLRPHLNSHRGPSWSSIQGCLQSNFMSLIKNTEKRASFLLCGWLWKVMTESFLSNNERLVQNVIVNHCLFSLDLLPWRKLDNVLTRTKYDFLEKRSTYFDEVILRTKLKS